MAKTLKRSHSRKVMTPPPERGRAAEPPPRAHAGAMEGKTPQEPETPAAPEPPPEAE